MPASGVSSGAGCSALSVLPASGVSSGAGCSALSALPASGVSSGAGCSALSALPASGVSSGAGCSAVASGVSASNVCTSLGLFCTSSAKAECVPTPVIPSVVITAPVVNTLFTFFI